MSIIDKPSDYFNTKLYTGTGSELALTGVGFQPDFTWIKGRSGATEHVLTDSVRGVTKELSSNDDGAEETVAQGLTAFGSDGFTVGTDGSYNTSSATYASWNWLGANGTASNGSGSITSTVSANTTSGFSIVTYTGNASAGATLGHGLSATPKMMLIKRATGGATQWVVYHVSTGNTKALYLNTTATPLTVTGFFNNTTPTSSVFTVGTDTACNGDGNDMIAYCFADVQGYSKFGSYTGNGNADGTFVYTGFKPAFVMIKNSSHAGQYWEIFDNKRNTFNVNNNKLYPNANLAEQQENFDIVSNGFKCRDTGGTNVSGNTYIYMAFAEEPFVTSTTNGSIPATAR